MNFEKYYLKQALQFSVFFLTLTLILRGALEDKRRGGEKERICINFSTDFFSVYKKTLYTEPNFLKNTVPCFSKTLKCIKKSVHTPCLHRRYTWCIV
jgi:hypothetical protein